MDLCVKDTRSGNFSSLLCSAESGTTFRFSGPYGYFVYRPSSRPAVFVATGTGIAPFVSMIRSGVSGFMALHGVKTADDLYYEHLFRDAARSFIPCISQSSRKEETGLFSGKVTEYIERRMEKKPYDFYLCGGREMIRDVTFLVDDLFQNSRVYTEVFY